MKKIQEKLSKFTKILLILGLLFTNLMPLSMVFAYEKTDDFVLELLDNNKIKISGLEDLLVDEEDNEATLTLKENYTYLDGETATKEPLVSTKDVTLGEIKNSVVMDTQILSSVEFDGLYEASVSLFDNTSAKELGTVTLSKDIKFARGLSYKLYDSKGIEIVENDGIYNITSSVDVKARLLLGGYAPSSKFTYEGVEYTASDLLEKEFSFTSEFTGLLYGEYNKVFEVAMLDENAEEVVFSSDIDYMYYEYKDNAEVLNTVIGTHFTDYIGRYAFFGNEKDGILTVLTDNKGYSVLELISILDKAIENNDKISYVISNSTSKDLMADYIEALDGNPELKIEEYFGDILVDNSTVISLTSDDLTITYKCILSGDLNNDNIINEDDLLLLINQVIGRDEANLEVGDLVQDEEINIYDVLYFNQVLENNDWNVSLEEEEVSFEAILKNNSEDITSGDEFTVDYVVTVDEYALGGIAGIIDYDKDLFELVDVTEKEEFIGNIYEGKYLYLTNDSLTGTVNVAEDGQEETTPEDYVLLTLTFKALKAGTGNISVKDSEYFNENVYYVADNGNISLEVTINKSSDNTLESLIVGDKVIELVDGTLSYEVKVSNDVTNVDVSAIVKNPTATVSAVNMPSSLEVGENKITIVVTAENGDELIYTVTVVREEAPQPTPTNYQDNKTNVDDDNISDNVVPVEPKDDDVKEPDEEIKKESSVSRIIIIILILLVIAGLIYLIFKDDKDDEETKQVNKDIDKMKKNQEFTPKKKETPEKKISGNKNNNKKGR